MGLSNEALRLANLGYRVFPLVENKKTPYMDGGFHIATTDEDTIMEWWSTWPNANVGVATEGLCVIDVDPLDDGSRNDWADDLDRLADLLMSAASITPRGGTHYWFRQPTGANIRNSAKRVAPGIDVRANGGYVVAPPSFVDDDKSHGPYVWQPGYELDFPPTELATPPVWFMAMLEALTERRTKTGEPVDDEIPAGNRNDELTSIGGFLRRGGLKESEINSCLQRVNVERCKPPMDAQEVSKIAWSVSRYEPDQFATAAAEGWADADKRTGRLPDPGNLPSELLNPGGFLGEVIRWNLSEAIIEQPELALAGALALLATITGRKIQDAKTGLRTNLYLIGVAGSGSGKEHARKVNKLLLQGVGWDEVIGPEGIASHAGLTSALRHHPVQLLQIDEFGRFLKVLKNPGKSPHLYKIVDVLLKLWSSANSLYIGDAYADVKQVVRINQPHAVLYGTTTMGHFTEALDQSALEDGFVARMLPVFVPDRDVVDTEPFGVPAPPKPLLDYVEWWAKHSPGGNLSLENPQPRGIGMDDAAAAIFREMQAECRTRSKSKTSAAVIWTRAAEKARKLAMLHAVSLDASVGVVGEASARWGCDFAYHTTEQTEFLSESHVSSSPFEAWCKTALRLLSEAGESGMSLTAFGRQCMRSRTPRERSDILNTLLADGLIEKRTIETPGRPATTFVAR